MSFRQLFRVSSVRRKLGEKRGDQMSPVLFVYVPKVEVEISHRGLTGIAHNFHVLDDCGTGKRQTTSITCDRKKTRSTNQRMVLPEPATYIRFCQHASGRSGRGAHVFHGSRVAVQNLLISNPGKYCLGRTMSRFPHDEHYMQCYGS